MRCLPPAACILAALTCPRPLCAASAGGTLIEAIANSGGRLKEEAVANEVALPLLRTLAAIHSLGVVHRCEWYESVRPRKGAPPLCVCVAPCRVGEGVGRLAN